MSRLLVLTGPRGSGKSTICRRVADTFRERGYDVGGIVTERGGGPPSVSDRRSLLDLGTGMSVPFGHRERSEQRGDSRGTGGVSGADGSSGAGGSRVGRDDLLPGWVFSDEVFAVGERAIRAARQADLLVVDELGPLELIAGRGWQAALPVLRERQYRAALVVCRPELLSRLQEVVTAVTEATSDAPPAGALRVYSLEVDRRQAAFEQLKHDLSQILGAPDPS